MKRAFRHLTSDILPVLAATYVFSAASATALTDANPYTSIVGRNTFALKPPAPAAGPVAPPATPPPNVSLQGISTILGRSQALLKVKIAPKPPDAAKELSLVMDVGQREGDVEVLSIDAVTGTVNLSNQGSPLTLNIKDADKPAAGPPVASLGVGNPALTTNPNVIGGGNRMLPPTQSSSAIPTYGKPVDAALPPVPALPNRPIRATPSASTGDSTPLSAVEQAAVMEIERVRTKDLVKQGKYPPLPPIPGITPKEE